MLFLERQGEHRGIKYTVHMNEMLGCRTGYVHLPKDNKYYGKYEDFFSFINCHGGITWAKASRIFDDCWEIGFATDNMCDGIDIKAYANHFGTDALDEMLKGQYKLGDKLLRPFITEDDCAKECISIIDQILDREEN